MTQNDTILDRIDGLIAACRHQWYRSPVRAAELGDAALKGAISTGDPSRTAEAHLCRGVCDLLMRHVASGIAHLEEARRLAAEHDPDLDLEIRLWQADACMRLFKNKPAQQQLHELHEEARGRGDLWLECRAQILLAHSLSMHGNPAAAYAAAIEAMELADSHQMSDLSLGSRVALGFTYMYASLMPEAARHFHACATMLESTDLDYLRTGVLVNLGSIMRPLGRYEEGLEILSAASALAIEIGTLSMAAHAGTYTAAILLGMGQIDRAIERQQQAIDLLSNVEAPTETVYAHYMMTELLRSAQRHEQCIGWCETTLELARAGIDPYVEMMTHSALAECYDALSQPQKAVEHYKRYQQLDWKIEPKEKWQQEVRRSEVEHELEELRRRYEDRERQVFDEFPGDTGRHSTDHPATGELGRRLIALHPELTPAELTVCTLVRAGRSSQQVADDLTVSVHTVETHRRNIRRKLGLDRRSNLYTYLLAIG